MNTRLPRDRARWRFSCRCEECRQTLLPSQGACPECGATRDPDTFRVEALSAGGRAAWHDTARGCLIVPAIIIGAVILIVVLASFIRDSDGLGLFCFAAPIGVVVVSLLVLTLGDFARLIASDVPQWSSYWAVERGSIWIDGGRIPADNIESATYSATSDLGMPMVEVRVAGQYVDLTTRHKLYLPCDPTIAEAAWRSVERQRRPADSSACNVECGHREDRQCRDNRGPALP
ncbi:MAG: hypothetical protein JNM94_18800 [Phycisphaerae bacterium]|nr:hypothetical protein [Phycisphaerae bacterium]